METLIQESDFIDVSYFIDKFNRPFNFFITARGGGKTYSSCHRWAQGERMLYIRNTDVQLQECLTAFGNPFKKYNSDHNTSYYMERELNHANVYDTPKKESRQNIGYAAALSIFYNIRGVDLSDVTTVWLEEFIQKKKLSYDQYDAFCHMYETVSRNRELLGEPPLKVIFTSNSQSLNNDILIGFNLVEKIERMRLKGNNLLLLHDILIYYPKTLRITEKKRKTALYRVTKGSRFQQEAIDNEWAYDDMTNVKSRNLKEYNPVCGIDKIYIYSHKSRNEFYVCFSSCNTVPYFKSESSLPLFMRNFGINLREAFMRNDIYFNSYLAKKMLATIIKIW